jgi:hypothetical protein
VSKNVYGRDLPLRPAWPTGFAAPGEPAGDCVMSQLQSGSPAAPGREEKIWIGSQGGLT